LATELRKLDLTQEGVDVSFSVLDGDEDKILSVIQLGIQQGFGECPICNFQYALKGTKVPTIKEVEIEGIQFIINKQVLKPEKRGMFVYASGIDKIQWWLNKITDLSVMYASSLIDPKSTMGNSSLANKAIIRWKKSSNIWGADGWKLYDQGGGAVKDYVGNGIAHDYLGLLNCPYKLQVDRDLPNVNVRAFTIRNGGEATTIRQHLTNLFAQMLGPGMTKLHVWGEWASGEDGGTEGSIHVGEEFISGGIKGKLPKALTAVSKYRLSSGFTAVPIPRSRGPIMVECGVGQDTKRPNPHCGEVGYRATSTDSDITDSASEIDIEAVYKGKTGKYVTPPNESDRTKIKQEGGLIKSASYVQLRNGKRMAYKQVFDIYSKISGQTDVQKTLSVEVEKKYAKIPDGIIKETRKMSGFLIVGAGESAVPKWYENMREETVTYTYSSSGGTAKDMVGKAGTVQHLLQKETEIKGCIGYISKYQDLDSEGSPLVYEGKTDAGDGNNRDIPYLNIEAGVAIKKCTQTYHSDRMMEICIDSQTNLITSSKESIISSVPKIDKAYCEMWPAMLTILLPAEEDTDGYMDVAGALVTDRDFARYTKINLIPDQASVDKLEAYLRQIRSFNWVRDINISVGAPIVIKEGNPCFSYSMSINYEGPSAGTEIGVRSYHIQDPSTLPNYF
jgi:hypothetical protein